VLKKSRNIEQVQAVLNGDQAELKKFFDEYFPRLYRFTIERVSGEHEAAREVVQITLSKILLNIHKFRGESTLFTWMCSVCNHEIFDFLKKQSKFQQTIVLQGDTSDLDSLATHNTDSNPARPEDIYGRNQKSILIHKTLDQLPANYGNVLEWKYIEGLSVNQIAARLQVGHSAAQSVLFRARLAFQAKHNNLTKMRVKPKQELSK